MACACTRTDMHARMHTHIHTHTHTHTYTTHTQRKDRKTQWKWFLKQCMAMCRWRWRTACRRCSVATAWPARSWPTASASMASGTCATCSPRSYRRCSTWRRSRRCPTRLTTPGEILDWSHQVRYEIDHTRWDTRLTIQVRYEIDHAGEIRDWPHQVRIGSLQVEPLDWCRLSALKGNQNI